MLELLRIQKDIGTQYGQFGELAFNRTKLFTVERPWLPAEDYPAGQSNISCIPAGVYSLVKAHSYSRRTDCWYIVNPDLGVYLRGDQRSSQRQRFGCMFHPANWVRQVKGCVAPGSMIYDFGGDLGWGVTQSVMSNRMLSDYLDKQHNPQLHIKWQEPPTGGDHADTTHTLD